MGVMACRRCRKSGCPLCQLYETDLKYRLHWGGSVDPSEDPGDTPRPNPLVCDHFEEVAVDRRGPDGAVCNCPVKWLYACDLHGKCARTRAAARPGVACCEICPDHTVLPQR